MPALMKGAFQNVVAAVGNTPIVRVNKVAAHVAPAQVYCKLEYLNPGGSVKDRPAIKIVEDAERQGLLKSGGTIVEATSGNTGMGLAMVAAVRGYKTIFVMPDKMSEEKMAALRAFGAKVVVCPTNVEPDDPRSYYSVARRLSVETPNAILANQYHNPANPEAHYLSTGPELWEQTGGEIDVLVVPMGTGGTISGTGRYLKERNGAVQVVGVDPVGSILRDLFYTGTHGPAEGYLVEGFGEDFLPTTTDFSVIDDVVQVTDAECFGMARRLVREEGIFGGGSCGAAVAGALRYARERDLGPDAVMVVLLPDSGSRYLSKVFNDDWMREHGFEVDDGPPGVVADLLAALGERPVITASATARIQDVVLLMKHHDISQVPVLDDAGVLVGSVSERGLLQYMLDPAHDRGPEATIAPVVSDRIAEVRPDTTLAALGHLFADRNIAAVRTNGHVGAVITKIDLIDFLTQRERAARG